MVHPQIERQLQARSRTPFVLHVPTKPVNRDRLDSFGGKPLLEEVLLTIKEGGHVVETYSARGHARAEVANVVAMKVLSHLQGMPRRQTVREIIHELILRDITALRPIHVDSAKGCSLEAIAKDTVGE